jgi:hypothetical protein
VDLVSSYYHHLNYAVDISSYYLVRSPRWFYPLLLGHLAYVMTSINLLIFDVVIVIFVITTIPSLSRIIFANVKQTYGSSM